MPSRHIERKLNFYSELYPASSAVIMGIGVVTIAMGAGTSGALCVIAGISLGVMGALHKVSTPSRRKIF